MAYQNPAIQNVYNRYQDAGRIGSLAVTDNGVWFFDVATAGVDLVPGQGVYLDTTGGATNGQWILPTAGLEDVITHIVSNEVTGLNTELVAPIGNADSSIEYPAGTPQVKAFVIGTVFVTAGAAIERGQELQYDIANDNYIPNALTDLKLLIVAAQAAAIDSVFPVRIQRIA